MNDYGSKNGKTYIVYTERPPVLRICYEYDNRLAVDKEPGKLRCNPATGLSISSQSCEHIIMISDTESRILEIISDIALTKVNIDDPLLETNLIDSVAAVDLALQIEQHFQCSIPPQEIAEHMKTARSLITYVLEHR